MAKQILVDRDDKYLYFANQDTGVIKKVALASEKQIAYLQVLRAQLGKPALKATTLPAYQVSAMINKLKKQIITIPPKML